MLAILSAIRVAGGATGIAGEKTGDEGVIVASFILSSIGSATLVAAFTGIINRIETGSKTSNIPPRITRYLYLISIVAIVMGSMGGSYISSDDPNTRQEGYTFLKVAAIFILVQFVASAYMLALQVTHLRKVLSSDRRLCYAAAAATPFIFVRCIYSVAGAFNPTSPEFSMYSGKTTAIILRAVLAVVMEIIATALLLAGGVLAPKMEKREEARSGSDTYLEPYRHQDTAAPPTYTTK